MTAVTVLRPPLGSVDVLMRVVSEEAEVVGVDEELAD